MKYMLLIYNNPDALDAMSEKERDGLMGEVDDLMAELGKSGELVGGEALAHPASTKTVRVRAGLPATTDGPFVEAKEMLAGYLMIEAESIERAVEIAANWPDAKTGAMEVRQVLDVGGADE